MNKEYDEILMKYIIDYVKINKVPPTLDLMLNNLIGVTSKSVLQYHLKRLVNRGLLVQKNIKGYYFPTCLDGKSYSITEHQINEILNLIKTYDIYENVKTILLKLDEY